MKSYFGLLALVSLIFVNCGGALSGSEGEAIAQAGDTNSEEIQVTQKEDAISNTGATVSVDAGFASDGTTITPPAGFQCKFTAAAANIDGSAISVSVSINQTTGAVTCKKVIQDRIEVPATTKGCVASYTMLCVK